MSAVETVEAAVFVDVGLVLLVAATFFIPNLGVLFGIAAMLAFSVLAARRRLRVVAVALSTAVLLSAVVLGPQGPLNMLFDAGVGATVGLALRRGWGGLRTVIQGGLMLWAPACVVTIGALAVFDAARQLLFAQMRAVADGIARLPGHVTVLQRAVNGFISHWPLVIAGVLLVVFTGTVALVWLITGPLLRRLAAALRDPLPLPLESLRGEEPGPVPVTLERVSFRYAGRDIHALREVSLHIPAGRFVGVIGANGSGKSTLGLLLAGMPPISGRVLRGGSAGLGLPGGTAIIGQRPESQVLGVRVRDDVLWGVAGPETVDVENLLVEVGLAGFADRETATLSGGQLQRVAVAGCLARRPALVISDESTSMLDEPGRAAVVQALARLRDRGVTVVHITHREEDLAAADLVVRMRDGHPVGIGPGDQAVASAEASTG